MGEHDHDQDDVTEPRRLPLSAEQGRGSDPAGVSGTRGAAGNAVNWPCGKGYWSFLAMWRPGE
jgi:hypothetical protein